MRHKLYRSSGTLSALSPHTPQPPLILESVSSRAACSLRVCWASLSLETALTVFSLLLLLKRQRVLKGHRRCNWALVAVAFLCFIFFLSFFSLPFSSLYFLIYFPRTQLARNLPPRTIGYPWTLVFGTAKHGMSIKTLYRSMQAQDTPVLLVIKDSDGQVRAQI